MRDASKLTEAEKAVEMRLDAERRAQNCKIDIENVLKRWGCQIDPKVQLSSAGIRLAYGIIPQIVVEAKPVPK